MLLLLPLLLMLLLLLLRVLLVLLLPPLIVVLVSRGLRLILRRMPPWLVLRVLAGWQEWLCLANCRWTAAEKRPAGTSWKTGWSMTVCLRAQQLQRPVQARAQAW